MLSPVRWKRDGRRRQRGAPTCPFGGGGCALRRADTAPRALTHWPTLAGPASGRASLSLSSLSPAGWRQRPECTPREAPWDSSGLQALPAHGSAPLVLGSAPAPAARRAARVWRRVVARFPAGCGCGECRSSGLRIRTRAPEVHCGAIVPRQGCAPLLSQTKRGRRASAVSQVPCFDFLCADLVEALSRLRGLGSRTPNANFPKPRCVTLRRRAVLIHFP